MTLQSEQEQEVTSKQALELAINRAGGQSALADAINADFAKLGEPREVTIRQSHVWYWLNGADGKVPAEYCASIERTTGVKRKALRPDVFRPVHQQAK